MPRRGWKLADRTARLSEYSRSVSAATDEALFEIFSSIEHAKRSAKTGSGDGESEDLLQKGFAIEAEILRRYPVKGMLVYREWLATQE